MPTVTLTPPSFAALEIVAIGAFLVPLTLDLLRIRLVPAVVVEILAGIIIGPSGFGWVSADEPVQIFSLIGLSFLLFLAGMEVDLSRLRGRRLRAASASFVFAFTAALIVSEILYFTRLILDSLLIAIILSSCSLGIVLASLKSAHETESDFGQTIIVAASLAEFGTLILLSLFFSDLSKLLVQRIVLLCGISVLAVAVLAAVLRAERSGWLSATLVRLQDSTAQVRVRGAFVLLAVFVVLAQAFGFAAILGAFVAGVVMRVIDPDESTRHPEFHSSLSAVGFGVFIPVFFVTTGLQFDVQELLASPKALLLVPVLLAALLVVRLPSIQLYRPQMGTWLAISAVTMQSTSLTFVLAASQIGVELGVMRPVTSAALTAAGLLTVVIYPAVAMSLRQRATSATAPVAEPIPHVEEMPSSQPGLPSGIG
jgi:Kef-type K+ transport system membrane component KefB